MQFALLGPFDASADGRQIVIRGNQNRVVLAGLLLHVNRPVSAERIASWLWEEAAAPAPPRQRATVRTYVQRIRQQLGVSDVVRTTRHGYLVDIDPACIDLHRFEAAAAEGRRLLRAGEHGPAAARFSEAIGLWRGAPLTEIESPALHEEIDGRLGDARLEVYQQWADCRLRLGDHREIVPELTALVRENPMHEPLAARLMTAYWRTGNRTAALAQFDLTRRALSRHLGLEPAAELRNLQITILRSDRGPVVPLPRTVPRELPVDTAAFTGRRRELAALDDILVRSPARIVAIDGPAGVGKTALAVHWAHLVREAFPDGQLYVDLRGGGFDRPVRPATAAARMLRSTGLPAAAIPADLASRSGLRTVLAERRMLIVLDNAADSASVRPLLPASGAVVLVTSRDPVHGLAVREGAYRLHLDVLDQADSTALVSRTIGSSQPCVPLAARMVAEWRNLLPAAGIRGIATALSGSASNSTPQRVPLGH